MYIIVNFLFIDFSSSLSESSKLPIDMIGDYNNGSSSSSHHHAGSSSSSSTSSTAALRHKARNVIFNIHYKYEVHKIIISDQADVGKFNLLLLHKLTKISFLPFFIT